MIILVVNTGSSSLKYQLINMDNQEVMAKGLCERIGVDGHMSYKANGTTVFDKDVDLPNHGAALQMVIDALTDKETGVVSDMDDITAVGHRVVQGGKYGASTLIDDEVIKAIEDYSVLAPLHNPPALVGIRACMEVLPKTPSVAVFDTSFHQTMPEESYLYAIPMEYYEKYSIRKYGYHGTSHRYVTEKCIEKLGKALEDCNIITCHLGNGSSITAVKNGKCYDTSMGLTPLDGLVMGTRCGTLDPSVVSFITEQAGMTVQEVINMMNKESGLLAVSGLSSDVRDVCTASDNGDPRAMVAREMRLYSVRHYIGAYAAEMGEVDAIVFTAGIGENDMDLREKVCGKLGFMGVKIDAEVNNVRGQDVEISTADSAVRVFVIPTNEELMIAKDTQAIVEAL